MIFTSFSFLFLFLPIVYIGFVLLSRLNQCRLVSLWLAGASIIFYAFWNPRDLLPLALSVITNYVIYLWMTKNKNKGVWLLTLGIVFNILFLGFYKYLDFFMAEVFQLTIREKREIPLGISFYTFTQIAFLVDCYHKQYEKNDFLNYFLFVSYFPHLVCGPILSFKELYPQLINSSKFKASVQNISLFIFCFSIGLFKKSVLGDYLGLYVTQVFDATPGSLFDFKTALLGTFSYSMQLYFDFSGYTDMAVGISYLFGLKIPDNFNAPYQATSIIDFWRRWHMSLSHFLKIYVYIPLGGNRGIKINHYRNLWITMLLGGLWHGASWTFIIWGVYQGALLSINHLFKEVRLPFINISTKLENFVKVTGTFSVVALGWVMFRSPSMPYAINIYKSLFGLQTGVHFSFSATQWFVLVVAMLIAFLMPDTLTLRERFMQKLAENDKRLITSSAISCALMALFGILCFGRIQYFLYSGF